MEKKEREVMGERGEGRGREEEPRMWKNSENLGSERDRAANIGCQK